MPKPTSEIVESLLAPSLPANAPETLHMAAAWLDGQDIRVEDLPEDVVLAAIEVACRRERADLLVALSEADLPKALRKASAKAIHSLKSRGVQVQATARGHVFKMTVSEAEFSQQAYLVQSPSAWYLILASPGPLAPVVVFLHVSALGEVVQVVTPAPQEAYQHLKRLTKEGGGVSMPFVSGLSLAIHLMGQTFSNASHPLAWETYLGAITPTTLDAARFLGPWRDLAHLGSTEEAVAPPFMPAGSEINDVLLPAMDKILNAGQSGAEAMISVQAEALNVLVADAPLRGKLATYFNLMALHGLYINNLRHAASYRMIADFLVGDSQEAPLGLKQWLDLQLALLMYRNLGSGQELPPEE